MHKSLIDYSTLPLLTVLLLIFSLTSCATKEQSHIKDIPQKKINNYLSDKPQKLHNNYKDLLLEGKRNYVLNQMQLGVNALKHGYTERACNAFDEARAKIESVYTNNTVVEKAKSKWYEEDLKPFIGEPYERAMVYYYRGLLFLKNHDFENARASFKNGILHDAIAQEKQHRCDFALLIFLQGWASQCNNDLDLAKKAYEEVSKLRTNFNEDRTSHNLLVILENGPSPRKVSDGPGHYELKFRKGRNIKYNSASIEIDSQKFRNMTSMENIFWQASTRGGRKIDKIIKGQAKLKQNLAESGANIASVGNTALIASPLFQGASSQVQTAGATLGLLGAAQMSLSTHVKPEADTRYWDNLPHLVHVYTDQLPPGSHDIKIRLKHSKKNSKNLQKKIQVKTKKNTPSLVWIKASSDSLHCIK